MRRERRAAAAADRRWDIKKFELHSKRLDQLLTPNGNTILHIHITARRPPGSRLKFLPQPRSVSSLVLYAHALIGFDPTHFVKEILGRCPDLLWKANKKGETLLHMAARHGRADVAKYLLQECRNTPYDDQEHGITPTRRMLQMTSHDVKDMALHEAVQYDQELGIKTTRRMTNEARDTALHEAVRYSNDDLDVVKVLTEADPELTYEANTGETPLYLAAERGYAKVLNQILTTCSSPGDHGPYDRTALHVAVIRKDEEMVETLLQAGEGIHKSKKDEYGWTLLYFAAHLGYIGILKKLLSKDKSAAYKACNEGKTALHVTAGHGRINIMQELISTCAGCCELVDKRGWNVLHFALESKNKKAVKLVLEDPWLGNLINEKDKNGNTPLLHAASIGYYHMRHPKVDMQVFNDQNHNAKDIILGNYNWASEIMPDRLFWLIENYNVKPGLCKIVSENDNIGEGRDEGNTVRSKSIEDGEVENEGITVPGGFVEDKGPDLGAANLIRNIAFRAFVILNTMSMFFSSLAVFNHLAESSFADVPDTSVLFKQMRLRRVLITYAMMAMIGAFLSGTYAVLHNDRNLAIIACVLPAAMFAYFRLTDDIEFLASSLNKMRLKLSK
ncbi:hypothetical protein LWI29_038146 [Acer saccharum]|uniref:PGG domain-containing protein n=1 Tax=Acer saccharum TaxID=4024 RepID=A0AA39W8G0_ACESA|nr:hypothetical protein LWI29_038146 [Acer saccharum]